MPAYLLQIAAAATAAGASRRTLSPLIRSQSPIAERDQRLMLTDADWSFDGPLRTSDVPLGVMLSPAAPPAPESTAAAARWQAPVAVRQVLKNRASAALSPNEVSSKAPDSLRPEVLASSGEPLSDGDEVINARRPDVAPEEAGSPAPLRRRAPEEMVKAAPVSIVKEASATLRGVGSPTASPPRFRELATSEVATSEADATVPSTLKKTPGRLAEPEARAVGPSGPPSQRVTLRSSEPLGKRSANLGKWAPVISPSEPTPSGVVIGRIEVEVVAPSAEKPAAKTAPRQPARSGPISQIGPLGGVPKHLGFLVRHR
jgi:hypothetical protein